MRQSFLFFLLFAASVPGIASVFTYDGPAFTKGVELQLAGEEQKAFEQWRLVLQQQPGHPGAYYHAGVGRFNTGELQKAKFNFNRSFDYPAKGFNAHYFLGRIAEKEKDYAAARSHYGQYLKLTKSAQGIAEVKGRLAQLPAAKPEASEVKQQPTAAPQAKTASTAEGALEKRWREVESLQEEGKGAEAAELNAQLLEQCKVEGALSSICRKSALTLADQAYEEGRLQLAVERYRLALTRWSNPADDDWVWYQLGNAQRGWSHQEALKAYDELERNFPQSRWKEMAKWKRNDAVWRLEHQELLAEEVVE